MSKRTTVTSEAGTAANKRVSIGNVNESRTMTALKSSMGQQAIHVDGPQPIAMITTRQGTSRWRGSHTRRGKHGIERLPGVAHTEIDGPVDERTRSRFRTMLDAQGNECSVVHTNGSAHVTEIVEGKWSNDAYTRMVLAKDFAIGRIECPETGGCLKRQLADKRVNPRAVLTVDAIKTSSVCPVGQKTCKHYEAERTARQAANAKREQANAERYRSEDSKRNEQLVAAAGTGAADAIATALAKVMPSILAALKETK